MLDEWEETTLGDVIDVKHGMAFQGEFFHDEPRGDILLTPGNFAIGGGFKGDKLKYYEGPVPAEFILAEGDLLITMTDLSRNADTLGYSAFVPARPDGRRYLHNQRLGKVTVKDPECIDIDYLHYLMRSHEYRQEVLGSATGTTVKHTSPERIKRFRFLRPRLAEQRAIAHILGTLDDKIELNRRMNQTLEAMAQALFKSWFVDFDPFRDHGMQDSLLGEIPMGWKHKSVAEAIAVNPSRRLDRGSDAIYVDMSSLPTASARVLDIIRRPYSGSGSRFADGDVLLARITPCLENGKTALVDFLPDGEIGWGSTEFTILGPKPPVGTFFIYCLARHHNFRIHAIQAMTGTSGRQRVDTACFAHYWLPIPQAGILLEFEQQVNPWFQKMKANDLQCNMLASIRDTLLPKLLSGEIRVRDAEKFVEKAL